MPNSATIVHAKVSTKPAVADASIIGGPDWNAGHVLTGLDQIDNTSDANKPVSTAQATADALVASNAASALSAGLALKANTASPTFTGAPAAPTASALTNTTQLATTAYADAAVSTLSGTVTTALAAKAPLASPALTGTPTAPTAALATNTTQLATTAFVLANASSAMVLLSNQTVTSSTAQVQDTTVFLNNPTYNEYEMVFELIQPVTTSTTLQFQFYNAAGVLQTSSYLTSTLSFSSGGVAQANQTTFIALSNATNVSNTVNRGVYGRLRLYGNTTLNSGGGVSTGTNIYMVEGNTTYLNSAGGASGCTIAGFINGGVAMGGYKITFSSGNVALGTVKTYGIV